MEHSYSLARRGSPDSLDRHEMRYLRPCSMTGAKGTNVTGPSFKVPTV